jgi:hypothetical protein
LLFADITAAAVWRTALAIEIGGFDGANGLEDIFLAMSCKK